MLNYAQTSDGMIIPVKVTPRSSTNSISGIEGDNLKVRLKAPPVEGRANEALTEYLSQIFDLKRSDVAVVSGKTSRLKKVRVRISFDRFRARLEKAGVKI